VNIEFSDNPAGRMATWWLRVMNTGDLSDTDARELILPGAVPLFDLHTDPGRQGLSAFHEPERPFRLASIEQEEPFRVQASLEDRSGRHERLIVEVEPDRPHRIVMAVVVPRLDRDGDESERPPSMTAAMTAAARASHRLWGGTPPVLDDELAIRIIPDVIAEQVRTGPPVGPAAAGALMIVVRSRYAEDALFEAIGRGTTQYVVLGAGLDTFAYRNTRRLPDLRIFEVDEPASQRWKRARLAAAGIPEPPSLTYVPVDLATQHLDQRLLAAGLDPAAAVFFSWLGVVYYLNQEAIEATLRFISTCGPGTEAVLDYMDPSLDDAVPGAARMTSGFGEPLISKFTPAQIRDVVGRVGMEVVRDLTPADAATEYFAGRLDGVVPTGQIRVLHIADAPAAGPPTRRPVVARGASRFPPVEERLTNARRK
jgi:methyltransferase (TIGR00027 family)